jgi:hypothetical protein
MKIIERLYEYLDFKKIKPAAFERAAGISNGYLSKQFSRKADIGEGILIQILEYCPDISIHWLLLGVKPMLKADVNNSESSSTYLNARIQILTQLLCDKEEKIDRLNQDIGKLLQQLEGFRNIQEKNAANALDAGVG